MAKELVLIPKMQYEKLISDNRTFKSNTEASESIPNPSNNVDTALKPVNDNANDHVGDKSPLLSKAVIRTDEQNNVDHKRKQNSAQRGKMLSQKEHQPLRTPTVKSTKSHQPLKTPAVKSKSHQPLKTPAVKSKKSQEKSHSPKSPIDRRSIKQKSNSGHAVHNQSGGKQTHRKFLSSSLESLTENLKCNGGITNFKHFASEFQDEDVANLLLRKNVYPYDYMNDERRFQETRIPPKDAFYSEIKKSHINEEDYSHACKVFRHLGLSNLGDYSDLYLKTDVLLLTDIFENFRDISMRDYRLDPCHFYSAPGLSWSAMLLMTKVNLELLTDIDDLLLWERGCRGGISQISHRYAEANNPYLSDYDPSRPHSYIVYVDAVNLYGWASMQPLPIGGFRRMTQEEISKFDVLRMPDDGKKGFLIEASLSYPSYLHDEHSCFPLAPFKRSVKEKELSPYAQNAWRQLRGPCKRPKCEKLLCTLEDKDHYVLHFRNLKLYLQLGLQIKEIHTIIEFDQEPWLKPYIDFNTMKRAQAKTEFEKSFYKILNNSVFGKLMEQQRRHLDVTLTSQEKVLNKLAAKPTFKECRIFNDSLVGVHCKRSKILISKPVYAGQTVLDISKVLMYSMWYCYVKRKYGTQCQLLCTDTDSFLFYVETDDIYQDMKNDSHLFDLSESNKIRCLDNKKVPGKFKDELNGNVIRKFCGLRSKMYAITYEDEEKEDIEEKKAKGVAKATIEKELCFKMYKSTLFDKTEMLSSMDLIRSRSHNLFCERVRKKTLSCFDDKRWLFFRWRIIFGIWTLSYLKYCHLSHRHLYI